VLKGELVTLRSLEREDLRDAWELANDIDVESRSSDRRPEPATLARFESWFERVTADPPDDRIYFVVEVDGRFVGRCTLWQIDDYSKVTNLGIALKREEWGKGYGQDACRVLVDYAFRHLNLRKVCLQVLADDERAVRAYRKAGFVEEGRLKSHAWHQGRYRDVLAMAVIRDGAEERP
jgi:RimJ/RimL family protein N-acetyltransferase